jgi:low temperature requirement protein LtrA
MTSKQPPADTSPLPAGQAPEPDGPLRVSTLELFFDLVFAFTLTQLSALLDGTGIAATSIVQVLLVFGVLWWMYGGYAWLTNTRTPNRTPERLLLLLGMAGFLVVGLAIRNGFGDSRSGASGIYLGLGYLTVVCVHGGLYYRVNRNIVRVLPVNLTSALLVLVAGLTSGLAAYLLWTAALAIQVLSPLVVRVGGRFEIAPAHFAERHGALVIVALGESVAAVGIGAAEHPLDAQIVLAAVLGLGVSAALWWVYFGGADDELAGLAMAQAPRVRRPALALSAYFYPHIPMLLGVVGLAAGVKLTIGHAAQPHPAAQALAIGGGTALFLAGHAAFRRALQLGPAWPRLVAALFALATAALGATVSIEAQLIVLLAGLAAMLAAGRLRGASASGAQPGQPAAPDSPQ